MSHPLPASLPPDPDAPAGRSSKLGWLWAVLPVALIALCGELGIAVLNNSALPVYFTKGLHIPESVYGLIMLPFFISEVLFKSPLGILADRFGRKPLMLAGTAVTVGTPLVLLAIRYEPESATAAAVLLAFGFLRLLDGLGAAALWPALFAYVGDVVEPRRHGKAMGVLTTAYMVGLAFGFLAGGWVDDHFGSLLARGGMRRNSAEHYFPSFYLGSALFAIAAILTLLFVRTGTHQTSVTPAGSASEAAEDNEIEKITWAGFVASMRRVPHFLILAFMTFMGMGCIALLVKLFALDEFGMTEQQFGFLVLWPALILGALTPLIGQLADKWGKSRCVRLGFLLCAIGLWGVPLLHHLKDVRQAAFMGAATVIGLGFALAFPSWMALLTSVAGARERGAILGAVSTAQGVGVLLGALIGTNLYAKVSHIAPFTAAAVLVTTGACIALVFVRDSISAKQAPN